MSDARADILIVGGGIIGCALAEELARRGARVTLLERGTLGAEASGAAAGILSAQMDVPHPGPFFELCQAARRLYPAWVRRLERASGLRVGFRAEGILSLALTAAEERAMDRQLAWQRRRGVRVERWSPREVGRQEPAVDGRIRRGYRFMDEAQVDNVALMRALAAACRQAGVRVREGVRVRRLLVRGGAVRGVETDRGRYEAPIVVNCLGSWAALSGAPVRLPVEPARGQMLAFQAPRGFIRQAVMSSRAYMVQRRDGRLLVGSTIERVGFEKALTLEGMAGILGGLRRMSRALDRCTFLGAWAGLRPRTPDDAPILGATAVDGLYAATGHFRHGILLAPVTAALLADQLLTGRAPAALAPFSPRRFSSPDIRSRR